MKSNHLKNFFALSVILLSVTNTYAIEVGYGGGGGSSSTSGGGGGIVVGTPGANINWSTYIAPIVNLNNVFGRVLGASTTATSTACSYLIPHQVMGVGLKNDPEQVKLLQSFLNREMGTRLKVNGLFGPATRRVAQNFQNKYKNDILVPWGLTQPTPFVYYTTIGKINHIMCGGAHTIEENWLYVVPQFLRNNSNSTILNSSGLTQ